jgi:hypothetical protein
MANRDPRRLRRCRILDLFRNALAPPGAHLLASAMQAGHPVGPVRSLNWIVHALHGTEIVTEYH